MKRLVVDFTENQHNILCNIRARMGLPNIVGVVVCALKLYNLLTLHVCGGGKIVLVNPDGETTHQLLLEDTGEEEDAEDDSQGTG